MSEILWPKYTLSLTSMIIQSGNEHAQCFVFISKLQPLLLRPFIFIMACIFISTSFNGNHFSGATSLFEDDIFRDYLLCWPWNMKGRISSFSSKTHGSERQRTEEWTAFLTSFAAFAVHFHYIMNINEICLICVLVWKQIHVATSKQKCIIDIRFLMYLVPESRELSL